MFRPARPFLWPLVLLLLTAAATGAQPSPFEGAVERVVDGDTIHVRVDGRVETVRYIGMNTPELRHPTRGAEPGGREAWTVNRELVAGKRAHLELDAQVRDRHGRLLAYVWVDGVMVNAELVRRGYAQVMTVPPNVRYQKLFLALQREARQSGRGLWAAFD
jgi:micrococcal nuclease